jgi:PST family polysaccharide transporter
VLTQIQYSIREEQVAFRRETKLRRLQLFFSRVFQNRAVPVADATVSSRGESADVFVKPSDDTTGRSVRGGVLSVVSHGARFVLRTGTMMLMARVLSPEDFGLQGMAVAMTGFLALFRDAGLSAVTVQRDKISRDQVSTLFWINAAVGVLLALVLVLAAPAISAFYQDGRLTNIVVVSAAAFVFNGFSVQHYALLQRQMRFMTIGVIEVASLAVSSGVGVLMALASYGYWALVATSVVLPLATMIGAWAAMPWTPGWPKRSIGMRSMLSMGGILTINGLVVYLAYNTEKVLLGRFWGPEALGIYGRAYQLISLPSDLLVSAIATVAFPSLSGLQSDPERLQRAFLRGYSLVLSLTIPTTIACALFAGQIVHVMLGPKWGEAVPLFRLLTPTILAFSLVNPLAWLLISSGRIKRSMHMAFLIAAVVIVGAVLGLKFGPRGVAAAFSVMMTLLTVPLIVWARAGTSTTVADLWRAIRAPLMSGMIAGLTGMVAATAVDERLPILVQVVLGATFVYAVYFAVLLYPLGQRSIYVDLANHLLRPRQGAA